MTDKLRKYVLPNIPYVFIGWAFLKLGTAYRLAAGSDFAHKFIGLGQTVGAAFADFAPGLAPFDWLVGIVGAVAFRLLIYFKSKNAKKYRRDAEYGSARWGNEKDIKPFADPKFENNMLLTATERLTMNTRPKNPANARNLNFCGIGSSGSGKTRFWLTPQLLQAHSSYVVVDPKGGVLGQVGSFLQKRGYKIKVFNSIDFSKSMHYNPLAYIKAIYDKNAETILGNMDSVLFLGGREASTIKEISENWLGKATISMQTEGRSRGQSESYSQNTQRLGRELMTPSELATMPGDRCILQLRGLPPFYSKKYDLKQHPNYRFTAEADKVKNAFDLDRLIDRRRRPGMNEECEVYEVSVPDEALTDEDEDILNYDDLDDPDAFV